MSDRPNPLGNIASKVGVAWSGAAGLVSALITLGVLTVAQGEAVTAAGESAQSTIAALGAVIAGVLTVAGGIISSFRTVSAGRDEVTPVTDPRTVDGTPLIPAPVTPVLIDDETGA